MTASEQPSKKIQSELDLLASIIRAKDARIAELEELLDELTQKLEAQSENPFGKSIPPSFEQSEKRMKTHYQKGHTEDPDRGPPKPQAPQKEVEKAAAEARAMMNMSGLTPEQVRVVLGRAYGEDIAAAAMEWGKPPALPDDVKMFCEITRDFQSTGDIISVQIKGGPTAHRRIDIMEVEHIRSLPSDIQTTYCRELARSTASDLWSKLGIQDNNQKLRLINKLTELILGHYLKGQY